MALGVLNNISSLTAENELTLTSNALSNTLQQLSSGSRINSGADDPAGLSIANGLEANISALTQSVSNANDGVGELQLADGALAQVTNLLNTAVTLATESATGTVSNGQRTAIQAQYASILAEINQIGTATTYNGQSVFQSGASTNLNAVDSGNNGTTNPLTTGTPLTIGDLTSVSAGGVTFSYTATTAGATNLNEVTGNTTGLTAGTVLNSGTALTLTRGAGGLTSIYTVGAGGATVAQLIAAVNTNSTQGAVTVSGTDLAHTGYNAALTSAGGLQITDLNGNNDLAAAVTGSSVANQVATTGQNFTANTNLIASGQFAVTRGTDVAWYTVGSAGATAQQLLTAINTGVSQTTGAANQGITVAQHAGGAASTANLTATLNGGNLVVTDLTAGGDGALTAAETGATNTNNVLGSVATLNVTPGSVTTLGAGDVFTATRNGTQLTTYTVGAAGANINQLVAAINTGISIPGANGAANLITVGTSGGGSATGLAATLSGGTLTTQALSVTDLNNSGDLAFTESGTPNVSQLTTNANDAGTPGTGNITGIGATVGSAAVFTAGEVFTINRNAGTAAAETITYTAIAAATVANLQTDIAAGFDTGSVYFTIKANGTAVTSAALAAANGTLGLTAGGAIGTGGQLVVTDTTGGTISATDSVGGILGSTVAATAPGQVHATATTGTYADNGQQLILTGSVNTNPATGTFTDNAATAPTVQNLLNAINNDTTVGAKAQLINGLLQISDPQDRNDLTVTTTDPVLGAAVSGSPTTLVNATTTAAATPNLNELAGNAGTTGVPITTQTTLSGVTQFTAGGKTFTFTANTTNGTTVGALLNAINGPGDAAGLHAYLGTAGSGTTTQLIVSDPNNNNNVAVGAGNTETALGTYSNPSTAGSTTTNIFLSDSTAIGSAQIAVTIGGLSTASITNGSGGSGVNLAITDLTTQGDSQNALTLINAAITNVASVRGTLGASVNRLTAASNVLNSQIQNLTSAENTITAADIPTVVANLTKYSILEQTGISALAQANQQQQLVLKLLQ